MKRSWRNLPFDQWPDRDRVAWQAILREGDILDGRGAGSHWSAATRSTNLKHYAGWLGWLASRGKLDPQALPEDRVTPDRVEAYARDLMACVAPITTSSYLRDLKVVIKAMAPEHDWRWLMNKSNRFKQWARPSRRADRTLPPAREMFRIVVLELDRLAAADLNCRAEWLAYRDTLLVGVLLACAPRLRNLAMIRIGVHLEKLGTEWHLRFAASETKNGRPLHLVPPGELSSHVERYIEAVRTRFPAAKDSDRLWLACKGNMMARHTIYDRVCITTERIFGARIPPHMFRSIAATFLAETSPGDALRARPLLGHASQDTTDGHYIRAQQIDASRKVNKALEMIRDH